MELMEYIESSQTEPPVSGTLHRPAGATRDALVLTHGAGSNADAPLLVAVADLLAEAGLAVLRCHLPFRQKRPKGPPFPAAAASDREGLRHAVEFMRSMSPGRVFLGGHSYGGRQSSMLVAENPLLVTGLLLLSYPLHPPNRPESLRMEHFPALRVLCLFVHGERDPFGTIAEMESAVSLIPARTRLCAVSGKGHDLRGAAPKIATEFLKELGG